MLDKFFFVVLILNTTGLFRFVALPLGVSIGQISLVLLALNVFYLIARLRYSLSLLRRGGIGSWLFVLLFWPLLTILYAPSLELRDIGLLLYTSTLFLVTVVYTIVNGLPSMHRMLAVSLAITIIGLGLSMITPQYFGAVAELANARSKYMGRAYGFFLQPNSLATGMVFLFIGWFALWRRRNTLLEVVAILMFLVVMLLTGSRTGMLVAAVVVIFILNRSWKRGVVTVQYYVKICILFACFACGIVGLNFYLSNMENSGAYKEGGLISRIDKLLSFNLSSNGGLMNNYSVQQRLEAQVVYLSYIYKKPLLGYGLGSNSYYQKNGYIFRSSHSTALTCAMEYGVLYPVVFAVLVLQLFSRHSRRDVERMFQTNSIGQFVFTLLFLFAISSSNLLDNRTLIVVLGMFLTTVYYPRDVFSCEESTGRIGTWLTRGDISRRFANKRQKRKPFGLSMSAECRMVRGGGDIH